MDDTRNIQLPRPPEPPPTEDLDDWIFRGEGWLASDR